MIPEQRKKLISTRLQQFFSPEFLDVIDDSAKHQGHAGAESGAGHYTVVISAECFAKKSRVAVHREIYRVLSDLIPDEIHALSIKVS